MKPSESLHRPDIKDVGFEEPAEEMFFDPKKEITQSDWRKMDDYYEQVRTDTNRSRGDFHLVAARLAEIDLGRTLRHMSRGHRKEITEYIQECHVRAVRRGLAASLYAIGSLSRMAIFEPEMVGEIVTDKDWDTMAKGLHKIPFERFQIFFCAMATIDPERARSLFTEEVWRRIEGWLSVTIPSVSQSEIDTDCRLVYLTSVMATINPERIRSFITAADWVKWKDILGSLREKDIAHFISLSASLTRLSRALRPKPQAKDTTASFPVVKKY